VLSIGSRSGAGETLPIRLREYCPGKQQKKSYRIFRNRQADSKFFFIALIFFPPLKRFDSLSDMKFSLESRILVFVFFLLFSTGAATSLLNVYSYQESYRDALLLRSRNLGNEIAERLSAGLSPSFQEEVVRKLLATDPEISHILIQAQSGEGSYASAIELLSLNDDASKRFSADAVLYHHPTIGKIYLVTLPILSVEGETLGSVHLGFSHTVLAAISKTALHRSLVLFGVGFPILCALTAFFLRRHLITPLDRLSAVTREISQGRFPLYSPSLPGRELSDLDTGIQDMALSLKKRDETILEGYQKLEQTLHLLQRSNEEQERTGAELKHTQTMFLNLFENATDAIVISDHHDRIVLFNQQAEKFFAIDRDKVIGRNLLKSIDLLRGDLRGQDEIYRELLKRGSYESQLAYFRPGQCRTTVGWVRATVAWDQQGRHWVQAIIRDITHERQVKENLERSTRELERLNAMKDSFLGLASHELKTPLTVIVGYSDLILTEKASTLDPSVLSMVRNVSDAADRLTGIVRDMVDVSKLDAQRLSLDLQRTDLNDFLREIAADHQSFLDLRRQDLLLRLDGGIPPICCDPFRMRQAFGNLIGNAIKFTPDGGQIVIESRLQCECSGDERRNVEIVIRDSGIGICEKDQLHIFDKFYEAGLIEEHFTGKYAFKGKGTGLGLTIAKGIVEMHGGRIRVESSGYDPKGCPGSSFHILIPAL
jgi:PAS domain S-box-containing protein